MSKTTTDKSKAKKPKGTPLPIEELIAKIREQAGGTIFSVGFIKRTNGEFRHMVCRLGVHKHLQGGDRAYDPVEKGLLAVYDVVSRGYRSIPLENVVWIKIRGKLYTKKQLAA